MFITEDLPTDQPATEARPIVPARLTCLPDSLDAGFLARIGIKPFKALCNATCPDNPPSSIMSLQDEGDENQFIDAARALPAAEYWDLVDALGAIRVLLTERGREILIECGATLVGETLGEEIVHSFLNSAIAFTRALERAAATINLGKRTYFLRKPLRQVDENALRTLQSAGAADFIRRECLAHFQNRGWGNYCLVMPIRERGRIGFFIEHGSVAIGDAGVDPKKHTRMFMNFRRCKLDAVFFHLGSKSLWVTAGSPKEAQFYASLIGLMLFNDPTVFSREVSFNTDFVVRADLENTLAAARVQRVGRLRLTEVIHYPEDHPRWRSKLPSEGRNSCLTELMAVRAKLLPDDHVAAEATLYGVIKAEKPYQSIIGIRRERLRLDGLLTLDEVYKTLTNLQVIGSDEN